MSADNWTDCPKCKAEDQLREDYEFYMMPDGKFGAVYSCECMACNWQWTFNETRQSL